MPRRAAITLLVGAACVSVLLLVVFWLVPERGDGHTESFETREKTMVFDFGDPTSETKSLELGMTLAKEDLRGSTRALIGATDRVEQLTRGSGTAWGTISCQTTILINGNQWDRRSSTTRVHGTAPFEDEDEAVKTSAESTYSEDALDDLSRPGDNVVSATMTCTSQVERTGPTLAIVTFGPLFALVTYA